MTNFEASLIILFTIVATTLVVVSVSAFALLQNTLRERMQLRIWLLQQGKDSAWRRRFQQDNPELAQYLPPWWDGER